MPARAMWKAQLLVGDERIGVKLYSAVEDRSIHFRLVHATNRAPIEQHIFRKDTGEDVPKEDRRKAFPLDRDTAVILQPEDLEKLEPPPSRDITLTRFVPRATLSDQWYDRPYYLGPDEDDEAYFAFAQALERRDVIGIVRWVMRKQRYLGALDAHGGFLVLSTLRRADQVLSFAGVQPEKTATPHANEIKLAEQLVNSISGDFDSSQWHNEYRQRVQELVEAKAHGETLKPEKPKSRPAEADLTASLKASLAALKERRVGPS